MQNAEVVLEARSVMKWMFDVGDVGAVFAGRRRSY